VKQRELPIANTLGNKPNGVGSVRGNRKTPSDNLKEELS